MNKDTLVRILLFMHGIILLFIISSVLISNVNRLLKNHISKTNRQYGYYPCNDLINNAIRFIYKGDIDSAIEELLQTIWKANGHLNDDIKDMVMDAHYRVWKKREEWCDEYERMH